MSKARKSFFSASTAALAALAFASSSGIARARDIIQVASGDVAALEAAVQTPDVIVKVAPGTYNLSGRLVLAENTDLIGSNEMIDRTGDGVPDPLAGMGPDDFVIPGTETRIVGGPHGQIFVEGSGGNQVAQVTIGNSELAAGVALVEAAEVVDCLLYGTPGAPPTGPLSDWGVVVANIGCTDCAVEGVVRGNVMRDLGTAALFLNVDSASGASVAGHFSSNRVYRSGLGVYAVGGDVGTTASRTRLVSQRNLFEGTNGFGMWLSGGAAGSNGNDLDVTSVGDSFRNQSRGIIAFGGWRSSSALPTNSNNTLRLNLIGARLENTGAGQIDLALRGANAAPQTLYPGENNVVEALIRRSVVAPETPPIPDLLVVNTLVGAPGNEVVLIGSDVAHAATNDPLDLSPLTPDLCPFFTGACD